MSKILKFTDTSVFQQHGLPYFEQLKRWGSVFNFTKLTEGTGYTNPVAQYQIDNSKRVFGPHGAGVYHFYHGESAGHFLTQFAKTGLKAPDTKFALDLEALELRYRDNTAGVNAFLRQLIRYGFRPGNLWVYVATSWIRAGWFRPRYLCAGFVWAAQYPTTSGYFNNSLKPYSKYNPGFNAWQFSGIAVHQDWSFDYTGSLLTPNLEKKVPQKKARKGGASYLHHGVRFTPLSSVSGYDDKRFKVGNGLVLAKGSTIPGHVFKYGSITRINTKFGYFTANRKYMKAAK